MKKSNLIVAFATLAAATIAAPAFAQAFYLGVGAGQSKVSDSSSGGVSNGTPYTLSGLDSNETTGQVNAGYQFTEMWGLEVQYTDLGTRHGTISALGASAGTGDVKAHQYGIAGTGTLPLDNHFFLRGKLGASSNHIDEVTTVVAGKSITLNSSSHTDVLAGIAIGYQWNKNFGTRLEYEYFGKFESKDGSSNAKGSNIGLRMQYRFF